MLVCIAFESWISELSEPNGMCYLYKAVTFWFVFFIILCLICFMVPWVLFGQTQFIPKSCWEKIGVVSRQKFDN